MAELGLVRRMRAAQIIAVLLAVHTASAKPPPTPVITLTPLQAAAWGIYAAIPDYPLQARRQRITGTGIFSVEVQIATGRVQKISVERSTGSKILDGAALNALNRWRFKPCPSTFTKYAPAKIIAVLI